MNTRSRHSRRLGALSLLAASGLAVTPLATAAASSRQHRPEPVTFTPVPASDHVSLTMVTYLPDIGAAAGQTLTALIGGFEKAHPNITVDVQTSASTTGAAISAVVQQDESAGSPPDVVQVGLDALRYTAAAFGAKDLDHIVGKAAVASEFGGDHPYATAIENLGLVNGGHYAIPWVLSTPVLFYDATLFQQAGLDPSKPPTNWSEVMSDALAIKKATGAAGISNCGVGASSVGVDWCTQAIVKSAGGTVLSKDGKSLTFDDPRTVYAMKVMQQLGDSGAMVNLTNGQVVAEFGQGKLAMVLNSSAAQAVLVSSTAGRYQVRAAKLPGFGTHPSVPTNSGSALSILSTTSLRQRASWELIRYLTSDSAMTRISENVGYAPLRPGLLRDNRYLEGWKAGQPLLAPNMAQLQHLVAWQDYPGGNYGQIETLLENAVASIAFQHASPSATMSTVQSQASALLPS